MALMVNDLGAESEIDAAVIEDEAHALSDEELDRTLAGDSTCPTLSKKRCWTAPSPASRSPRSSQNKVLHGRPGHESRPAPRGARGLVPAPSNGPRAFWRNSSCRVIQAE